MRRRSDRYPRLKRSPDGKPLCRGCGAPVPKGRRSWCSTKCYQDRCPSEVIRRLYDRDKGVCSLCGLDANWEHRTYCAKLEALAEGCNGWESGAETRRLLRPHGMPHSRTDIWWHADHIKEFSEGGETVLENMQTLCIPCHKKKTAEFLRKKAFRRKLQKFKLSAVRV